MMRDMPIFLVILILPSLLMATDRNALPATLLNWQGEPDPLQSLGILVTDRPDFTEAGSTVGLDVMQLEVGYTYVDAGDADSHAWGEPLLRVGVLANWLECRIGVAPTTQRWHNGVSQRTHTGFEDLYLGVKIALTPQDGWLPEMALIPQMLVPTGSGEFTNDRVLPGLNWIYAWELTESCAVGGSTQYNTAVEEGDHRYDEWTQSLAVGHSLTEWIGVYTEWYASFTHQAREVGAEHYWNGGFSYLQSDDLQFDVRIGAGLNDRADDFIAGVGAAIRCP
jgi:hypothetical protein